jgi:hypothetical protein
MFGLDKLMALKKQAEEVKARLNTVTVEGDAAGGKIIVHANGNRKITHILIDENWMRNAEKQELEDLILTAINRALEKAEAVSESEMRSLMPGLGF